MIRDMKEGIHGNTGVKSADEKRNTVSVFFMLCQLTCKKIAMEQLHQHKYAF